jgi:hypothetical protein
MLAMPMHQLHFVLNLKVVVSYEVNYWNYNVVLENFKARLEQLIFPSSNKVVAYKELEFGL